MTSNPPSPTPTRRATGWLLRGVVLLAVGVGAYYGLEVADRVVMDRIAGPASVGPIEVLDVPPLPNTPAPPRVAVSSEGPGNLLLRRAAVAIEGHGSIGVRLDQHGVIDGLAIDTSGRYYQLGAGSQRQFLLEQTGQLAGTPARLLRVSDSRFLWTDMAWGDPSQPEREVTRIDLRQVRRAVTQADDEGGPPAATDPNAWSRFGGLPMLLSGLDESFTFGAPRVMQFRNERVAAMVGRWRPERMAALVGDDQTTLPERVPQHVVVALSEATLFPLLVEYRNAQDALSAPGLPDEALLTDSAQPLLKMDIGVPEFGERLDARLFSYRPSGDDWADQTEREVRLANPYDAAIRK
ncbi:hypothetical protein Pla108_06060 [Botrimarina colliarenosi]|uniref:Uncharacterized protein n=1 Tax=Botrimarina colliarenosi TaxID=2528001 RepID=A0A5C6ANB6_9BACT|nr:hypothetical protein [Botrimarina colliarenosi]TWT99663.1 hypothetical protein Pla108_06060 [Botrimarina colliarenosi]